MGGAPSSRPTEVLGTRPSLVQAVRREDRIQVTLRRFSEEDLAAVRAVPGRRWNAERGFWEMPDSPATLAALRSAFGSRLVVARAAPEGGASKGVAAKPQARVDRPHRDDKGAADTPAPEKPVPDAAKSILEKLALAVRTRGYSSKTERAYEWWTRRFLTFRASRAEADIEGRPTAVAARAFLEDLATRGRLAPKTRNQAASALGFLLREVLGETEDLEVPHAKGPRRLPSVMSHREVLAVLRELSGKHALAVGLLYSGGLRIEECLKIRVKDLDLELRQVLVRDGKGQKDRYAPLAHRIIEPLRNQVRHVKDLHDRDRAAGHGWAGLPSAHHRKDPGAGYELGWQFVFPARGLRVDPTTGRTGRGHLHPSAVQRVVKAAARRSGVAKRVSCHTFRHSFATEALRGGCDIRTLQHVLGHTDVRTTMIYLHVVEQTGINIRSPLDRPDDPPPASDDDFLLGRPPALTNYPAAGAS